MKRGIRVRIEGLMSERLLMRALEQGAQFFHVCRDGKRAVIASCDEKSAVICRSLAEQYHLPCAELSRHGIQRLRAWFRQRWTLFPMLCLAAMCAAWMLGRIWAIDISLRSETPSAEQTRTLQDVLRNADVYIGMSARDVDISALSAELSARAEGFSYVTLHRNGIRLSVEAVPERAQPEIYDIDAPRDLIASRDGRIVSVNAQSGQALVAPGDLVRAGDVLIRGTEQISKEDTRRIAALGEVIALGWSSGSAALNGFPMRDSDTGNIRTSVSLCLFDAEIPMTEAEPFALSHVEEERIPIVGLYLPAYIKRVTFREYTQTTAAVDEDILRAQLEALAMAQAYGKLGVCQIEQTWVEYQWTADGILHAKAVVEYSSDIAVPQNSPT